jgi:hypothetical protein
MLFRAQRRSVSQLQEARVVLTAIGQRVASLFAIVGRHPTAILVLPSAWMFWRFLPFWKDVDAVHQLISPAWAANILHFPPIYCFGGRLPLWLTDKLLFGTAPSIFEEQHPSLEAGFALLILQHVSLWAALRYFLFSLPLADRNRGIVTVLLASVASFYAFAHTCGSEAMTSVTWFAVFGAGFRILAKRATWRTWIVYVVALLLAIGSRQINGLLVVWLPFAALVLLGFRWYSRQPNQRVPASREVRIAGKAIAAGLVVLGIEHCLVAYLCQHFDVIRRSTIGGTLSERVATLVNHLSVAEKDRLLVKVDALASNPNVRVAIESQIKLGPYHMGTDQVIQHALETQGLRGEEMQAERDRVILRATLCFYRTLDPRLVAIILKEFARGWVPTSDYRIAVSGPSATFALARAIESEPSRWSHLPQWPTFDLRSARHLLVKAAHDPFIRHWEGIPILAWCVLFTLVGAWRLKRNAVSPKTLLIGLTVLGLGAAAYGATCVCVYSTPRYTLPLLVSVFAFGSIVFCSSTETDISS